MTDLEDGQLAMDVAKLSTVEVVDSDVGAIVDQKDAMRDLISSAEGNKKCGFGPETRCVEVRYVGIDSGSRTYTMPETRIKTSEQYVRAIRSLAREVGIADDLHSELGTGGEDADLSAYE